MVTTAGRPNCFRSITCFWVHQDRWIQKVSWRGKIHFIFYNIHVNKTEHSTWLWWGHNRSRGDTWLCGCFTLWRCVHTFINSRLQCGMQGFLLFYRACHGSSQSILAPFSLLSVYFQFVWAAHCIWCYFSTQKGKREDHEEKPKEELYEVVWNKSNISVARNYFISCFHHYISPRYRNGAVSFKSGTF